MADLKTTKKEIDNIALIADEVIFRPDPSHHELKAQFWNRFVSNPLLDRETITLSTVQEILPEPRLKTLWALPGFREWFCNNNEIAEKVDFLLAIGMDSLEFLFRDPNVNPAAKVNAFKVLAEIKGLLTRGAAKGQEKFSDDTVNKMSESELKSWLKKQGVTVEASYQVRPGTDRKPSKDEKEVFGE